MSARTRITRKYHYLFFAANTLAWVGCGGTYDSYVSGVVSLDGSPLPRGTISYNPTQPGPASYGVIRSDGSYSVNTGREEGLPSGEYIVTVVAKEPSIDENPGSGLPPKAGKNITPPWYRSKKTSDLKVTLESGSNTIDLELTSEPPPDWKPPKKKRRRRR